MRRTRWSCCSPTVSFVKFRQVSSTFTADPPARLTDPLGADPNHVNANGASVLAHAPEEGIRELVREAIVERITRAHEDWARSTEQELQLEDDEQPEATEGEYGHGYGYGHGHEHDQTDGDARASARFGPNSRKSRSGEKEL